MTNGARATQRGSREGKGEQEGDAARANGTAERAGEGSKNNSRRVVARTGPQRGAKILSRSNNNNRDSLTPPPLATLTRHCCGRDGRGWSSWKVRTSEDDGCWVRMEERTNCGRSIGNREMRRHMGRSTGGRGETRSEHQWLEQNTQQEGMGAKYKGQ